MGTPINLAEILLKVALNTNKSNSYVYH
jgi:hypothetical protein